MSSLYSFSLSFFTVANQTYFLPMRYFSIPLWIKCVQWKQTKKSKKELTQLTKYPNFVNVYTYAKHISTNTLKFYVKTEIESWSFKNISGLVIPCTTTLQHSGLHSYQYWIFAQIILLLIKTQKCYKMFTITITYNIISISYCSKMVYAEKTNNFEQLHQFSLVRYIGFKL